MNVGRMFVFIVVLFTPAVLNAQQSRTITLDSLSLTSLLLEARVYDTPLYRGTGFIVESRSKHYLISNRHVFSGIDSVSKKPSDRMGRVPDRIRIWYHGKKLPRWEGYIEKLINEDGSAKWIQLKDSNDVAALPILLPDKAQVYPFDLGLAESNILATVGMPAFVIGYPSGLSSSGASRIKEVEAKVGVHRPGFPGKPAT